MKRNELDELDELLMWCAALALCVLMALCLGGCRTVQPIERVVERTDTVRQYQRDSVRLVDSVFVDRWRTGDTVFVTKTRDRYLYRDILHTDTVRLTSIQTEQVQVKFVPPFYKNCTIGLFVVIALLIGYSVVKILIRIYLK